MHRIPKPIPVVCDISSLARCGSFGTIIGRMGDLCDVKWLDGELDEIDISHLKRVSEGTLAIERFELRLDADEA